MLTRQERTWLERTDGSVPNSGRIEAVTTEDPPPAKTWRTSPRGHTAPDNDDSNNKTQSWELEEHMDSTMQTLPAHHPGPCNYADGRKEPTHRRKGGANTHRRRKESASMGGRSQIDGGEEGTNTIPPGGGGGRTWALCCPPSQHQSRTLDPRFRKARGLSTT